MDTQNSQQKSKSIIKLNLLGLLVFGLLVAGYGLDKLLPTIIKSPQNQYIQVSDNGGVISNKIITTTNLYPQLALDFAGVFLVLFLLTLGFALYKKQASIVKVLVLFKDSLSTRPKNYGGIVYNLKTGKPIAFAKVSVSTEYCITDLEGRYILKTQTSKNLQLVVQSLGYKAVTKAYTQNLDFALIPQTEESFVGRLLSIDKNILFTFMLLGVFAASIWGFIVSIYAQAISFNNINIVLIAIYSVLFILAVYPTLFSLFLKKVLVKDSENKKLSGAVVRVYKNNSLADICITNSSGIAKFNLDNQAFSFSIKKLGFALLKTDLELTEQNLVPEITIIKSIEDIHELELDLQEQIIQSNHAKFNLH